MKFFSTIFLLMAIVAGCNTSRQASGKQEKQLPVPVLSENLQEKLLNGVDLFARGNTPASWTLEMDFGNLIRFKSLDGTEVNSTAVQAVDLPEEKATSYTNKASKGDIIIKLYEQACTDGISGEQYNKKVTVTVNDKRYEGCGQYLFDPALNGKWILEKMNNEILLATDFAKGLPIINVNIQSGQITGHDGCNNFTGGFEVLGNKIKFKPLAATKMACPANKKEKELTALLSGKTVDYYFKDGQLYFYLPDDSIIIFKKG